MYPSDRQMYPYGSGIIDEGQGGATSPRGKLNVKTGPRLVDILIFSIFCIFRGVFIF